MLGIKNSRRTIAQIAGLIVVLLVGSPEVLAQAPSGFIVGRNSGVAPAVKNGEVIFNMRRGDCQKRPYGDGRGESDCSNGNSRSQLNAREKQRIGRSYEYSMEIWVDPAFRYNGRGWGKVNYRSRLWIAEWQRSNTIKNHMYEIYLDSAKGVTFEDKRCFSPNRFGQWNSVVMRVKWSNGTDGFLQVICNGREIYSLEGPNVIPPGCGEEWKQQCKPAIQDLSQPILWSVGPSLKGHGMNYRDFGFPSAFPPFPEGGITLKIRNLYVGRLRS